jgi:hypothetical protein
MEIDEKVIIGRVWFFLAGLIFFAGITHGTTVNSGFELTGDTLQLISEEQPEAFEQALNDVCNIRNGSKIISRCCIQDKRAYVCFCMQLIPRRRRENICSMQIIPRNRRESICSMQLIPRSRW